MFLGGGWLFMPRWGEAASGRRCEKIASDCPLLAFWCTGGKLCRRGEKAPCGGCWVVRMGCRRGAVYVQGKNTELVRSRRPPRYCDAASSNAAGSNPDFSRFLRKFFQFCFTPISLKPAPLLGFALKMMRKMGEKWRRRDKLLLTK